MELGVVFGSAHVRRLLWCRVSPRQSAWSTREPRMEKGTARYQERSPTMSKIPDQITYKAEALFTQATMAAAHAWEKRAKEYLDGRRRELGEEGKKDDRVSE